MLLISLSIFFLPNFTKCSGLLYFGYIFFVTLLTLTSVVCADKATDINKVNRLHITLGLVCLVLDNVFPDEEWRENRTNILKIYEEFKSRDSFKDTVTN